MRVQFSSARSFISRRGRGVDLVLKCNSFNILLLHVWDSLQFHLSPVGTFQLTRWFKSIFLRPCSLAITSTGRVGLCFCGFHVQEHTTAQPAVVLFLNRLRRRGHGFKSHPTDWDNVLIILANGLTFALKIASNLTLQSKYICLGWSEERSQWDGSFEYNFQLLACLQNTHNFTAGALFPFSDAIRTCALLHCFPLVM